MAPFICLYDTEAMLIPINDNRNVINHHRIMAFSYNIINRHDKIVKSRDETLFTISEDENLATTMIQKMLHDYQLLMQRTRMGWNDEPILTDDEMNNFNRTTNCMICS